MTIGFWDLVLVVVVTLQTTALAYAASPKWKAWWLMLPLPFTTIVLSLGLPFDAANVLSLAVLFIYTMCVHLLSARIPIVWAIVLSVFFYALTGHFLVRIIPATDLAFWTSTFAIFVLGILLLRIIPAPNGPNYRTPLPLWQKLPAIFLVVAFLIAIKNSLQGFAALFPMLSTVGAYEVRHNTWLLVRPVPVLMCALTLLIVVVRLTQNHIQLELALLLGWVVYIPALLSINRWLNPK